MTAAYVMLVVLRGFVGQMLEKGVDPVVAVISSDNRASAIMCVFMIGIGIYPAFMVPVVQTGVQHILHLLGVA